MNLDQLRHFYEAARNEHIGKAAKILRASPSGISYSIECLEKDLGVQLFAKRGKRIFLTEAGRRLMERVPTVEEAVYDLRQYVGDQSEQSLGHLRLGGSHVIVDDLLTPCVGDLLTRHPSFSCELFSLRSSEVLSQVMRGELDLGICFSPQAHPTLDQRVLHKGRIKVYVRAGHPLLKARKPMSKLDQYSSALPKAFGGIEICQSHPMFEKYAISPDNRMAFDNYDVAITAIKHSDCWGFLPDWFEKKTSFRLKAVPLPRDWQADYTIAAIWQSARLYEPGIDLILSQLL